MAAYIDRRLTEKIRAAGESGQVEAVIVVKEQEGLSLTVDDGDLARQVVEGAAGRAGDLPSSIRYFPRANAAVISSSGRLIQEILMDENLIVASATEIDTIIFFSHEAGGRRSGKNNLFARQRMILGKGDPSGRPNEISIKEQR
jgi:hypothetical protein